MWTTTFVLTFLFFLIQLGTGFSILAIAPAKLVDMWRLTKPVHRSRIYRRRLRNWHSARTAIALHKRHMASIRDYGSRILLRICLVVA